MKKKILYLITQSELGGAQRYILDLAGRFKKDFDITVAFGEQGDAGEAALELKKARIKSRSLRRLKRNIAPISDLLAMWEIRKLIKSLKPDVVHLNSSKISVLGSLAVRNLKQKPLTVYTAHGWIFSEPMNVFKKKLYLWLEKKTAAWKDRIICLSRSDRNIARDVLGVDPYKLKVIHNGFDSDNCYLYEKEEARIKLLSLLPIGSTISQDTVLIGAIGNLYATKDYPTLIKAMNYLLVDYGINFTMIIIGDGPERAKLEVDIGKFNSTAFKAGDERTDNRIILAGRIPNAAKYLKAFDYYVCSSAKEGFPYSLLETMAAGVPIVATRVGGIPELVADQQNGMLASAGDARQIAKKLVELHKNKDHRERLVEQALHDVSHLFSFDRMTSETKKVYLRQE